MQWRFRKLNYDVLVPKLDKSIFKLNEESKRRDSRYNTLKGLTYFVGHINALVQVLNVPFGCLRFDLIFT